MVLEAFFRFLQKELNGDALPLTSLQWGTEVQRLPAAPEFIPSIAEKGVPDDFPSLDGFSLPEPQKDCVSLHFRFPSSRCYNANLFLESVALSSHDHQL